MAKKNLQAGFSLIELLIVVAIIGIIAAIAVPNLLASRRAANEGSAISSLRVLMSAQLSYQASNGNGKFAPDIPTLVTAIFVDNNLGSGSKNGYSFQGWADNTTSPGTYWFSANPAITSGVTQTGTRRFGSFQDGVIRVGTSNLGTQFDYASLQTTSPLQ
jgi:type IV pilus assembly protein PilA